MLCRNNQELLTIIKHQMKVMVVGACSYQEIPKSKNMGQTSVLIK